MGALGEPAVMSPCHSMSLCPPSVLPSEASPSVPLHFVEREGPEINIFQIRQDRLHYVPPLHGVERGPGGEASEGRRGRKAEALWSCPTFRPPPSSASCARPSPPTRSNSPGWASTSG